MAVPQLDPGAWAAAAAQPSNKLAGYGTRELTGHKRRVCTLGWNASGRKLASGSHDCTIRIWAVEHSHTSRAERAEVEFKGHTNPVSYLDWKPGSDSVLASTGEDKDTKTIRLWDVRSGKSTSAISTPTANVCVSWSPNGSAIAASSNDDLITVVDVRTNKLMNHTKPYKSPHSVYEIKWGPTEVTLMMATDKGTIDFVSMASILTASHSNPPQLFWSKTGHSTTCWCFATDKEWRWMASGGGDALVSLFDLKAVNGPTCVRTWAHMDNSVRSISLSADGSLLAYGGEGGELEVLDTATGEKLSGDFRLKTMCDSVAWCPTANVLAFCDEATDQNAPRDHRGQSEAKMVGIVGIYAPPKAS